MQNRFFHVCNDYEKVRGGQEFALRGDFVRNLRMIFFCQMQIIRKISTSGTCMNSRLSHIARTMVSHWCESEKEDIINYVANCFECQLLQDYRSQY